jgi:hypothetical protein
MSLSSGMTSPRLTLCLLSLGSLAANAQVAPLKPGLWEVKMERKVDGQKAPDFSDRLKNMPPERRAQMEAALEARGVSQNGNAMRVCHTKETLDRSRLASTLSDCKTDFDKASGSTWKGHTTCEKMHLVSDTEIRFLDSKNYVTQTTATTELGGRTRKTETTTTGKWISADCGNVQPMTMPPQAR